MAEITRRRVGELQRGVFEVLRKHAQGLPAKEVLTQVEGIVPPTPFESSEYPKRPGVRRYEKMIRFATIAPVKAGWMIKSRGTWSLTEAGSRAHDQFTEPERFHQEAWKLYRAWSATQLDEAEPEDTIGPGVSRLEGVGALEEAEELAWTGIEEHLQQMPAYDFQNLVAALLRAMGYHVSWVAPPGKDGGTDIIANTDPLGTQDPRIRVQVKRRADKVTVDGLRSFLALLGAHDVGLFVPLGGFTSDAEAEARSQSNRKVTLLDGERLVDLWIQYYAKIPETDRLTLPLKPVHYLAPGT